MACHCQQDELYAAEHEVPWTGDSFESIEQVQEWVDRLRESAWWERNFPNVRKVYVEKHVKGRMDGAGLDDVGHGVVPWWPGWGEMLMLHEVCHVLTDKRFGNAAHSPWFCRMYLEMVSTYLGPEVYLELQKAMDRHGVDHDTDNMIPAGRFQL